MEYEIRENVKLPRNSYPRKVHIDDTIWTYRINKYDVYIRSPDLKKDIHFDIGDYFGVSSDEIDRAIRKRSSGYRLSPLAIKNFILVEIIGRPMEIHKTFYMHIFDVFNNWAILNDDFKTHDNIQDIVNSVARKYKNLKYIVGHLKTNDKSLDTSIKHWLIVDGIPILKTYAELHEAGLISNWTLIPEKAFDWRHVSLCDMDTI